MPNDATPIAASVAPPAAEPIARSDQVPLLAFIADAATEAALREGLAEAAPPGFEVRRGNVRTAIAAFERMSSPRVLVVDVSGEEQPLTALGTLSEVVEPTVCVLVIGQQDDVNFYRHVTRGLGALEYLYKPLVRDMVSRHFAPLLSPRSSAAEAVHSGRVVTITGVRGGVGATTIAASLAWHFGVVARRHTLLLDPDLHRGNAALLLDARAGPGLRIAIEAPDRIDPLFVERAAQPVRERLFVLAGEEKPAEHVTAAPEAATTLLGALRRRFNFVVADVPFLPLPLHRDLLDLAHQRVLVLDPTLTGIREALRLLSLPNGKLQPVRPVLVLNRAGLPGSLPRPKVEAALEQRLDVVIPDLPRKAREAAAMGEPLGAARGPFRDGVAALAREVGFVRLLDSSAGAPERAPSGPPRRRSLFGWRR
jgi:pilus assembly protein CpaE